jgi:hypothetical protein
MGHSSINVTVDICGNLVPGGNRQAVDKLDDWLPSGVKEKSVANRSGNKSGNNCKED